MVITSSGKHLQGGQGVHNLEAGLRLEGRKVSRESAICNRPKTNVLIRYVSRGTIIQTKSNRYRLRRAFALVSDGTLPVKFWFNIVLQ